MTTLRSLSLNNNRLGSLPPQLAALQGLKTLLLQHNRLGACERLGLSSSTSLRSPVLPADLPIELAALRKLETLNLAAVRRLQHIDFCSLMIPFGFVGRMR